MGDMLSLQDIRMPLSRNKETQITVLQILIFGCSLLGYYKLNKFHKFNQGTTGSNITTSCFVKDKKKEITNITYLSDSIRNKVIKKVIAI